MNEPKNHHYVSRCHQKEFLSEKTGRIFLFDKELNNFYSKNSTKHLFSQDHLNTKETKNGIDQESLELELKILFEDDFPKNVAQVKKLLTDQRDIQSAYESLCWLTLLGILGELRHPYYKKSLDETMIELQSELLTRFSNFPKEELIKHLKEKKSTPYDNANGYINSALRILERLEPLDFFIVSIESNDFFILPDTSSFQMRGQLKAYPNSLINEIIQVGIPITSKLYILATPQTLKSEMHGILYEKREDSDLVYQINKDLYTFSKKAVACADEEYLKKLVTRIKSEQI